MVRMRGVLVDARRQARACLEEELQLGDVLWTLLVEVTAGGEMLVV